MLEMRLVTSLDSLDLLIEGTICKANPLPANCGEVPAPGDKATTLAIAVIAEAKPAPASVETEAVPLDGGREMRFVLVRGKSFLCGPDCPEWISAEGTITAQTPERLHQLLDAIGDRRLPLVISSPGGDLLGALAAGRLIRERKLDVAVARTEFVGCDPGEADCAGEDGVHAGLTIDAEGECSSACPIMLAGGIRRLVGPQARLNVHSMGIEQKVKPYLEEMAIGSGLLVAMQSVLYSSHRQLDPSTMRKFGLTTGPQSVDELRRSANRRQGPGTAGAVVTQRAGRFGNKSATKL